MSLIPVSFFFFFFNDTATTEIYTLSLHDALPISGEASADKFVRWIVRTVAPSLAQITKIMPDEDWLHGIVLDQDRKSTRLNSSHSQISYAVFCLKKKKKEMKRRLPGTGRMMYYSQ